MTTVQTDSWTEFTAAAAQAFSEGATVTIHVPPAGASTYQVEFEDERADT